MQPQTYKVDVNRAYFTIKNGLQCLSTRTNFTCSNLIDNLYPLSIW